MQRKISFVNEELHHVFNRGAEKRPIFLDQSDYERYITSMYFLNSNEDGLMSKWRDFKKFNPKAKPWDFKVIKQEEKLVDIICYCLNENHHHKILKQLQDKGIENFMQKIGTSYAMYFNKKYDHSGTLYQGPFKSVYIDTNEYLLYLSVYVNANHFIHGKSQGLALEQNLWPYSSLPDYLGKRKETLCDTRPVLDQFKDIKEYEKFLHDNALYMKEKKEMEKYILE